MLVVESSICLSVVWILQVLLESWQVCHILVIGSEGWEINIELRVAASCKLQHLPEVEVKPGDTFSQELLVTKPFHDLWQLSLRGISDDTLFALSVARSSNGFFNILQNSG